MSELDALSPAKRALLERALAQRRAAAAARQTGETTIPRRRDAEPAPLSFAQERMWFLAQWDPEAPTFNGARAFRLCGRLNLEALRDALHTIVTRHEALRTRVVPGEPPRQVAQERWSLDVRVATIDERQLADALVARAREPFDLTRDVLLRASVFALHPEEHVLVLCMHHIAADAHSDSVLFAELTELYAARCQGRVPDLPELPIQYADFAAWQRAHLTGARLDELVAYWRAHLAGAPDLLPLPTDRPRPAVQRHEGSHLPLAVDRGVVDPLVELARAERATFYMAMLAAFATLLYRITGEADVVIGSPIANRNHVELQGLIGFFTNTLALRTRLTGNPSFREVLRRTRATALDAYAHQELPFEKVVEAVAPRRDPGHNPLFVVNFRAQAHARPPLRLDGLAVEPVPVDIGFSRFDLALEVELREERLTGYIEFNHGLFEALTAAAIAEDLEALLRGAGAQPDRPVLELALPHGRRLGARAGGRTIARRRGR